MQPEAILSEIASGNELALRQLYDLYHKPVYNTCISLLQHAEEAEEATQDVFVEIFLSAKNFRQQSSVRTWIYRIAVNKCLDRIRYHKRKKRFAFMTRLFHPETGHPVHDQPLFEHPGVRLEQKERAAFLFRAIGELPDNQRTAFILKQVEGLSQKEMATVMNMSEKAVESLLQRAKTALRKILNNYYDQNEGNKKR